MLPKPVIAMAAATLLVSAGLAAAEVIPAGRRADWSAAGVPGGIPSRTTIYVTLPAGASASAIQAAIAACPPGQVVKLAPGVFGGNLAFGWKSQVTLRGSVDAAGRPATVFNVGVGGVGIEIGGNSLWNAGCYPPDWSEGTAITAGLGKGSTALTVASADGFTAGLPVRIDQANPPAVIWNASAPNTRHDMAQNSRVTAVKGNIVSIWPPLLCDFTPAYAPRLKNQSLAGTPFYVQGVGLEDLRLVCSANSAPIALQMEQAYGCWIRNVQITNCPNYSLQLVGALQCTIEHCDIRNAPATGPNHFGIGFFRSVGYCLVQNNVVDSVFPNLEISNGSSGNVFAYNYFGDSWQDGFGMGGSCNVNHGPGNLMNLYEGNVVETYLQSDGYHGGSFNDVIFRNRIHGVSPKAGNGRARCLVLNRWTACPVVVGNVSGTPGVQTGVEATASGQGNGFIYQFGYPNMGDDEYRGTVPPKSWDNTGPGGSQHRDLAVRRTMLFHANYDTVTRGMVYDPAITDRTIPDSLYLTAKPAWFGTCPWPPVDPANPSRSVTTSIPAGYRFVFGVDPPSAAAERRIGKEVIPPFGFSIRDGLNPNAL